MSNLISASIVADSRTPYGERLTTLKLVIPRFILAELNTHRMLSRNSASSRAIPFKKMVEMINKDPFVPIKWMKEHNGMQGYDYFNLESSSAKYLEDNWLKARDMAVMYADTHTRYGGSKQIADRLLEPFMYHMVLVSATDWENMIALRLSEDAEIHFQDVTQKIVRVMNISTPIVLEPGDWHIPYGDSFHKEKLDAVEHICWGICPERLKPIDTEELSRIKIASARCARLSYQTFGDTPKDDYEADIKLHDKLLTSGHMSPFEHIARVMTEEERDYYFVSDGPNEPQFHEARLGNFGGFIQYRKLIEGENQTDIRLYKK